MGHRLPGHLGLCKFLHGHNYLPIITVCSRELDDLGRVIDFSALKGLLEAFDHATLLWEKDPLYHLLHEPRPGPSTIANDELKTVSMRVLSARIPPTAEYIAELWLLHCQRKLESLVESGNPRGVRVVKLEVFETSTSSATACNLEFDIK